MLRKALSYLPLIIIMMFLVATVVYAHGGDTEKIHSCVDKNGKLRIVSVSGLCGKNEENLDWNIQGPPSPAGSDQFVVVDSGQREVGIMIDQNQLAYFVDPFWVIFHVLPNEIFQFSGDVYFQMFYLTNDCSGTPYVLSEAIFRRGYVSGTKVFYPDDPYEARIFQSNQGGKWGVEPVVAYPCESYEYSSMSGPAENFDISEFTPPFTIRTGQ